MKERIEAIADYKNMEPGKFLQAVGTDAYKWADAFMQIWGDKLQEVSHGLMIGWFANAMVTQHDKATAEIERLRKYLETMIDALTPYADNIYQEDADAMNEAINFLRKDQRNDE